MTALNLVCGRGCAAAAELRLSTSLDIPTLPFLPGPGDSGGGEEGRDLVAMVSERGDGGAFG